MKLDANFETPLQIIKRRIEVLERHQKQLTKALRYGGDMETFDDVCAKVLAGRYIMHELPNSVVLCERVKYGGGIAYHTYLIAGDLEEVLEFQRGSIQQYAKDAGCNLLSGSGRIGWKKPLIAEGWKAIRINFVKEID